MQYDDVTVPLALTDCDILNNKPPPQSIEGMKGAGWQLSTRLNAAGSPPPAGGQFKAIRIHFSLPSASYATMAVRELTKMETSSHYQTQLNTLSSQHPAGSEHTLQ